MNAERKRKRIETVSNSYYKNEALRATTKILDDLVLKDK